MSHLVKRNHVVGISLAVCLLVTLAFVDFGLSKVEGRYLDRSYRICRNHDGLAAVDLGYQTVTCRDGFKKNFVTGK